VVPWAELSWAELYIHPNMSSSSTLRQLGFASFHFLLCMY
jgi:hypothetical protein